MVEQVGGLYRRVKDFYQGDVFQNRYSREEHQPWHVPRSTVVIASSDIGAETNLDDSCRL